MYLCTGTKINNSWDGGIKFKFYSFCFRLFSSLLKTLPMYNIYIFKKCNLKVQVKLCVLQRDNSVLKVYVENSIALLFF